MSTKLPRFNRPARTRHHGGVTISLIGNPPVFAAIRLMNGMGGLGWPESGQIKPPEKLTFSERLAEPTSALENAGRRTDLVHLCDPVERGSSGTSPEFAKPAASAVGSSRPTGNISLIEPNALASGTSPEFAKPAASAVGSSWANAGNISLIEPNALASGTSPEFAKPAASAVGSSWTTSKKHCAARRLIWNHNSQP